MGHTKEQTKRWTERGESAPKKVKTFLSADNFLRQFSGCI